jgi:geranylgeranyl pyrophosphate synthase
VDDVLGIWGEPDVTGKPAAGDLRQHKKTLPVAHALAGRGPRPASWPSCCPTASSRRIDRALRSSTVGEPPPFSLQTAEHHPTLALAALTAPASWRGRR